MASTGFGIACALRTAPKLAILTIATYNRLAKLLVAWLVLQSARKFSLACISLVIARMM
jgi:hypothetical protein